MPIYSTASQSQVKLKVQVSGFNLEQCTDIYQRSAINLSARVLCAGGEDGKDSCRGMQMTLKQSKMMQNDRHSH